MIQHKHLMAFSHGRHTVTVLDCLSCVTINKQTVDMVELLLYLVA